MDFSLWTFALENLDAAGAIGGYVSISIVGFALISFASRGKGPGGKQVKHAWAHPIIGAAMGVIPGCGATIVVSSMYKNKKISFGGLFAAFIATLGEGSFVLLGASDEADVASNLTAFVTVNLVGFILGVILGYVVDVIGFGGSMGEIPVSVAGEDCAQSAKGTTLASGFVNSVGFYILLAMAVFLAPGSIMALWGGGIAAIEGITVWVTTALAVLCIVYYLVFRFAYHGHCHSDNSTVRKALVGAVADIAMVVSYVFVGLFVANFIIDVLVGAEAFDAWMKSSAYIVVAIAALIGATPGCGGMIAVTVAYVTIPNFPMAALIAAAIATSGDGIFPLLAANRKDAIVITASGLGVALVVGYAALLLGV
jgi:hypothetical protein